MFFTALSYYCGQGLSDCCPVYLTPSAVSTSCRPGFYAGAMSLSAISSLFTCSAALAPNHLPCSDPAPGPEAVPGLATSPGVYHHLLPAPTCCSPTEKSWWRRSSWWLAYQALKVAQQQPLDPRSLLLCNARKPSDLAW